MAINLKDIPDAIIAYLDNKVAVTVENLVPAAGDAINVGELFTFKVRATNASAADGGVALTSIVYVVSVEPDTIARVKVPTGGTSKDQNGNVLTADTFVSVIHFHPSGTDSQNLSVGESDVIAFSGKAFAKGAANIKTRIRGAVDENALFPKNESTPGRNTGFTVSE